MTRINGFFFLARVKLASKALHLDVHLSMRRSLEEFADG